MKKILVLSSRLPWPLISGDRMRIFYISKILARDSTVDLACIHEGAPLNGIPASIADIYGQVKIFSFPKRRFILNSFVGLFSKKPLQVHYYYFRSVQKWINEHGGKYDLIICNHIRMSEYLRNIFNTKIIDFHDALSENYTQAIPFTTGAWRWICQIEKKRVRRYETEMAKIFNQCMITAVHDKNAIQTDQDSHKIIVIPMGVKPGLMNLYTCREENWITFLGKLDYKPNEDAIFYFATEVYPFIRKEINGIVLNVIGFSPTRKVKGLKKTPAIKIIGECEDPYDSLRRSKVIIAPIRYGSGIQNKVLEGMALGKTVVTTPAGATGIPNAKNGEHLVVADPANPVGMAAKIIELFKNDPLREQIGRNARDLIARSYTWDKVGNKLLDNLKYY